MVSMFIQDLPELFIPGLPNWYYNNPEGTSVERHFGEICFHVASKSGYSHFYVGVPKEYHNLVHEGESYLLIGGEEND